MQFLILLALLGFLQAALAQEWQVGGVNKYTTLMGVHAVSATEAYGSVIDNNVGAGLVRTTDSAATGTFFGPVGAMNMDIAVTGDKSTVAVVGLGGIFLGQPASANFAKVEGIHGITQNVEAWGEKGLGVTGQFTFSLTDSVNGVTVSKDAGQTWAHYDIGVDATHYYARYGAFPSDTTWYVTSGMWPSDERAAPSARDASQLSAYLRVKGNNTLEATPNVRAQKLRRAVGDNTTGWYGGISRTTNGGETWTQVFNTDLFYFNQIHCTDTGNCLAVGENDDNAFVVGTKDGGNTWQTVLTAPAGVSLVAVRMLSPNEAWVAGGAQSRAGGLQGYYYHTTDAGASWTLSNAGGYAFDLSFSEGAGYSAFLTQSYSTMGVYK